MDRNDAVQLIIGVLREVEIRSGQSPCALDQQTHPIGGIPGFDSLLALEATVEIEHQVGHDLPNINLFVNESTKQTLSVSEIAEKLCKLLVLPGRSP